MITTSFHLPEAADALLADTRRTVLLDARVEHAARTAPDRGRPFDPETETHNTYAERAWRYLLPSSSAGDALNLRMVYGWTEGEINQIKELLLATQAELRAQAPHVVLEGTRANLLRDADRINRLLAWWAI